MLFRSQQRVAIARAIVTDPDLVVADEPTGDLDAKNAEATLGLLRELTDAFGKTIVMVTHDPRVEEVADRVLWLEDGRIRDRRSEVHSWARDPVCGMKVDGWSAEHVVDHTTGRYVFCSQRCLQRFAEDPDAYASVTAEVAGREGS